MLPLLSTQAVELTAIFKKEERTVSCKYLRTKHAPGKRPMVDEIFPNRFFVPQSNEKTGLVKAKGSNIPAFSFSYKHKSIFINSIKPFFNTLKVNV